MSNVISINSDRFEEEVIKSPKPVLVDFWATWCGPCLMMAPVLDQVSLDYADQLKIVKIDVDQNQDIAYKYQIASIPNLKLFKDGQLVSEFVGFRPPEMFKEELKNALK